MYKNLGIKFFAILQLLVLLSLPDTTMAQEDSAEVCIEYIAHASFRISYKNTTLLLDPYADKIWLGYNFPKGVVADAIFSTHPHYDHDGGQFRGYTPYWKDKIPFYQDTGDYSIGDFEITGFKGKHCDPYGKEFDQKNTIWKITVGDVTIAHLGDNGPLTEQNYTDLGAVDILLIAIDSQYHILKKDELKTVLATIGAKVIVPMHYRIPELETLADKPEDLGEIEPWLQGKQHVLRLAGNTYRFSKDAFDTNTHIIVFKHDERITK